MSATERELAAFWLGFGAALGGAFGSRALERLSDVLAPRILPGGEDRTGKLLALLPDLPGPPDAEIDQLIAELRGDYA